MTMLTPSQWIETMEILRKYSDTPLEHFGYQEAVVINLDHALVEADRERLLALGWGINSSNQLTLEYG